jgi:hypothetical protein
MGLGRWSDPSAAPISENQYRLERTLLRTGARDIDATMPRRTSYRSHFGGAR